MLEKFSSILYYIVAMDSFVSKTTNSVFRLLGIDGIFFTAISIIIFTFLLTFIISLIKVGYGVKKKLLSVLFVVAVLCVERALLSSADQGEQAFLLSLGVAITCSIPVFAFGKKAIKTNKAERSFARQVENSAKSLRAIVGDYGGLDDVIPKAQSSPKVEFKDDLPKESQVEKYKLDFEHVKSVISRLQYFDLSGTDKKQIRELENALYHAENVDFNQEVKGEINEGLGALLKIMARHGV